MSLWRRASPSRGAARRVSVGAGVVHASAAQPPLQAAAAHAHSRAAPADPLTATPPSLDAASLAVAAAFARAAGAAYAADDDAAAARVAPDGFALAGAGENWFTRWVVLDSEPGPGKGGAPRRRVIAIRGVVWGREGPLDGWRLGRSLARAWPGPLLAAGGGGCSPALPIPGVRAHAGAADLAGELWHHLRGAVRSAPADAEVTLVGHSLGGALALLTAAAAAGGRERPLGVTQFGAPPVLAADPAGGGGPAILASTGLVGPVRSFVSAGDPVPRAGLAAADPAVAAAAAAWAPVASAARSLGLGAWVWGDGGGGGPSTAQPSSLFPAGYAPVGDTYLVSWTLEAGHAVRPLAPAAVGAALVAAAPETVAAVAAGAAAAAAEAAEAAAAANPLSVPSAARRALGAWLDHAHTSYADDLAAAAVQAARAEQRKKGGK